MTSVVDRFKKLEESLEKLKRLSESVDFKTLVTPTAVADVSTVKFAKGECKLTGIAKCKHYSVIEADTTAGSEMATHEHPGQTEIIIVLEGDITVDFENERFVLGQYDTLVIHKGIPHKCSYVLPGKTLAILIPTEGT